MRLTDAQLSEAYSKIVGWPMTPHHIAQAKLFIDAVLDLLPARGYIDETDAVAFDAFELGGNKVEPTFTRPEWE